MPYRFLNPYNFVRWLSDPGKNAAGDDDFGRHGPNSHELWDGLRGVVTCVLEAQTPLFIPDAEHLETDAGGHKTLRFCRINGDSALPGSSLKGMVRSVFEAATNSCLAIFDSPRLSYHLSPNLSRQLVPARVEIHGGKWQLRLLTGTTPLNVGEPPQGKLYAGWVRCYDPINRRTVQRPRVRCDSFSHGDLCWALLEPARHPRRGFEFWNVQALAADRAHLPAAVGQQRIAQGWLCITHQNIENKHDERFFFSTRENARAGLPKRVREAYRELIRDYQERHADEVRKREARGQRPDRPQNGEPAYSRFILESRADLREGDLVYAMLSGSSDSPQVEFLVPVSVPRVGYEHTVGDLLPDFLHPCSSFARLCPACRTFGWVHPQGEEAGESRPMAFGGRVRFSHGCLIEEKGSFDATLAILSAPKPTTTRFYLLDGNGRPIERRDDETSGYDGQAAHGQPNRLRGRKLYRHHGQASPQEYERVEGVRDDQNRTVRDVLRPGARFRFMVEFENLSRVELGALLWSLTLESGWHHRLGAARPLGFGSVTVTIETAVEHSARRYLSLGGEAQAEPLDVQGCIAAFKKRFGERFHQPFEQLEPIQDLRALLTALPSDLPVHYPRSSRQPQRDGRNYEWFMGNKRPAGRQGRGGPRMALQLPPAETQGLPLLDRDGNQLG